MKNAIITGAGRSNGLGLHTAITLGKLGFHVIPTVRTEKSKANIQEILKDLGISFDIIQVDLDQSESVRSCAQYLHSTYACIDVLINNAAINFESTGSGRSQLPSKTPVDQFRKTFETNVLAVISVTQALLPLLLQSEAPRIVNVSSVLASLSLHSDPQSWMRDVKLPSYDMSKTALNSWTVELAWEFRNTKMKINSAHPGWVKTDMGGEDAPLEISQGIQTMVSLATLPSDGPTGGFFHLGESIPW